MIGHRTNIYDEFYPFNTEVGLYDDDLDGVLGSTTSGSSISQGSASLEAASSYGFGTQSMLSRPGGITTSGGATGSVTSANISTGSSPTQVTSTTNVVTGVNIGGSSAGAPPLPGVTLGSAASFAVSGSPVGFTGEQIFVAGGNSNLGQRATIGTSPSAGIRAVNIHAQVRDLVRQIKEHNPQFTLQVMKSPTSAYNEATVRYLEVTLEAHRDRQAEGKSPRVGMQEHHIQPISLRGAVDGATVRIDPMYHQLITNAFRDFRPYGSPVPSLYDIHQAMQRIYEHYPLP